MDLENLHQYHFGEVAEADEALLIGWAILEAKKDISTDILCLKNNFEWSWLVDGLGILSQSEIKLEFWEFALMIVLRNLDINVN